MTRLHSLAGSWCCG